MATTEKEQKKFGDNHPVGKLIDEWADWVSREKKGDLEVVYDEDEDIFKVARNERTAVVFTSDIDEEFYGEAQALFVESEIGQVPVNLDLSQTLKFSGNELVLSRISLSDRDGKTVLLVEGAVPVSKVESSVFDLLVQEVSTIARDLRKHLASVLKDDEDEDEDDDDDDYDDDDEDDDE